MDIRNKKVAIVGAGMSGAILAQKLSKISRVTIFDKSRGIGGRMATRRFEDFRFDHGAQFFTAKSKEFQEFCTDTLKENIIDVWNGKFCEITNNKITKKLEPGLNEYFVAKPQMNSLCKYLVQGLDPLLEKKIDKINFENNKWSLGTPEGENFNDFDYLILAIPSHQALDLLPKSFKDRHIVSNTNMVGCFSLMLGFKENIKVDFDAAFVKESLLGFISINSSKPERPEGFCILVNSNNKWAQDNIEEDLDLIKNKMTKKLKEIIDFDLEDLEYNKIHRWRYANAESRDGNKSFFDPSLNLGLCGDWLISGRVESAFLSGLDLYSKVTK
jgi:predicted NAD/FAD-dependent oxidoreductase